MFSVYLNPPSSLSKHRLACKPTQLIAEPKQVLDNMGYWYYVLQGVVRPKSEGWYGPELKKIQLLTDRTGRLDS